MLASASSCVLDTLCGSGTDGAPATAPWPLKVALWQLLLTHTLVVGALLSTWSELPDRPNVGEALE